MLATKTNRGEPVDLVDHRIFKYFVRSSNKKVADIGLAAMLHGMLFRYFI